MSKKNDEGLVHIPGFFSQGLFSYIRKEGKIPRKMRPFLIWIFCFFLSVVSEWIARGVMAWNLFIGAASITQYRTDDDPWSFFVSQNLKHCRHFCTQWAVGHETIFIFHLFLRPNIQCCCQSFQWNSTAPKSGMSIFSQQLIYKPLLGPLKLLSMFNVNKYGALLRWKYHICVPSQILSNQNNTQSKKTKCKETTEKHAMLGFHQN